MYNFNPFNYNSLLVNSIEEAKNAPIDFGGNPILYLNKVKNEVYLKQFNINTGKTFFGVYAFVEAPAEKQPQNELEEIKKQLNDLYQMISEKETKPKKEKGVKDDE